DPDLVERFKAEARAAARLTHPNVVGVYDWGFDDDRTYYMVMEYVPGTDVRDVLVGRGSVAPTQAAEIVACLCDALAAAHAGGLVHRDVKPENVLIARDGTVKVADFGIAAVAGAERTLPGGGITGTLRYISPEQARGEEATYASDIWAAGAVLGELLTGRPPQQGSGAELLRRRAAEPPEPPSRSNPAVTRDLDNIVMRACALDPADRFMTATEMGAELRRILAHSVPVAPLESLVDELTGEISLPDVASTNFMPRKRKGRMRRALRQVVVALLVMGLIFFGGGRALSLLLGADTVDVPRLIGMPKADAEAELARMDLQIAVAARRPHPQVPRGAVVEQTPDQGSLAPESTVAVVISTGPPEFEVPDVVGATLSAATVQFAAFGFEVREVTRRYGLEPEGTVVEQIPADGLLPSGSEISLVLSRGPQPLPVPLVAGMEKEKALKQLRRAGFVPVAVDAYSDDVTEGLVISTDPPAESVVDEGSEIKVFVSVGPKYRKLRLPDVTNMYVEDARAKLEGLGLRVSISQSCPGRTTVIDTDPLPGTIVHENDVIKLFLC
ncbi:MAG TPA: PASTA domain-containing protein, partial [Actinomycetota bacterium]|nr:PASTA domain-containing protein [Actinomycetota bacterium]